jgi:hypothetical protein
MADLKPLLSKSMLFPPIGDPPPMALGSMGSGMPSLPMPTQPSITVDPHMATNSSDPLFNRGANASSDLADRLSRSQLSGLSKPTTTLGKIGHVAANIGNVLGDIFAPSTMALIPGTGLNNQVMENRDRADINDVSQLQTAEAGRKQTEANTDYLQQKPEIEQTKITVRQQTAKAKTIEAAAKNGQKPVLDEDGNISGFEDDPDLLAHAATQAQIELRNAQTDLAASKNDPSSPAYAQAERRIAVARANAIAAQTRANAYMGNYKMHAEGVGLDNQPLNGIGMLDGTSVGTSVQGQVSKTIAAQSQFKDVNQGIQHTTGALQALAQEGGSLNDSAVVAALQDPTHTATEWAQGKVNSTLTPNERDAVVAIKAMRERILAMRKASGGTASEGQVHRMLALLPGPQTPDLDTAMRQLKEVQAQADVLGSGIPQIHRNSSASSVPPSGATHIVKGSDGKEHYTDGKRDLGVVQ